ncbi:MAG: S41 family peptidase [Candidatus Falkowbacteria bacterium]|nr:S41 family peptidase [Candidatus Falkowbacteria bacterium]
MKIPKKIITGALVLVIAGLAFTSGFYSGKGSEKNTCFASEDFVYLNGGNKNNASSSDELATSSKPENIDFSLYGQVWALLSKDFVNKDKLNSQEMFYGSLKGLTASMGDPYTVFMDPKETQEFSSDMAGTFEGIGAEIASKNNQITIVAPLDGMPAQKAGLKAGDKILAINGTSTAGMTTDAAVRLIRGPKGTTVKISIMREGFTAAKILEITREIIIVKSVKVEFRKDGLAVLRISSFGDDTLNLFEDAVKQIQEKKPKGLILDLRNNPGGYLDSAVAIASEWIPSGRVVTEKFSDGSLKNYSSNGNGRLENLKTAVLVNGGSASASEIVSGALLDLKKGTIIGEKTFGKGSVQSVRELSDGSSLKVTVAKWLTPAGNSISDIGITPNIEVKLSPDDFNKDKDPQLNRAVELLLKNK